MDNPSEARPNNSFLQSEATGPAPETDSPGAGAGKLAHDPAMELFAFLQRLEATVSALQQETAVTGKGAEHNELLEEIQKVTAGKSLIAGTAALGWLFLTVYRELQRVRLESLIPKAEIPNDEESAAEPVEE